MATAATIRQHRYMDRQERGLIVLQVEAHEERLIEVLTIAEFLPQGATPSREELRAALQRCVDIWTGNDASIEHAVAR